MIAYKKNILKLGMLFLRRINSVHKFTKQGVFTCSTVEYLKGVFR